MGIRVKSSLVALVSLMFIFGLSTNPGVFAQAFDPAQILRHTQSYDGKPLTVSGTVRNTVVQTTRQGKEFMTFELCDAACMKVFTWGHVKLREGQHESVSGTFKTVKHVDLYSFQDVLEAHGGSIR
jgi:cytochrome c-type biogenesis protein CcmE